jgi:hypothetical protein
MRKQIVLFTGLLLPGDACARVRGVTYVNFLQALLNQTQNSDRTPERWPR